jgi:hypothetical protein
MLTYNLWPLVSAKLKAKYNIIAEIDLYKLGNNPSRMYQTLRSAYKDHYDPNDRILIYHYDTDFYQEGGGSGFIISNLMTCLNHLDISECFCLLLTNHYGISNEINQLSTNKIGMQIFENNYTEIQTNPNPNPIDINVEKIVKPYICLNGAKRSHRVMVLCYLREHQLLDRGIVSWNFNPVTASLPSTITADSNIAPPSIAPVPVITTPVTCTNDQPQIDNANSGATAPVFVTTTPFTYINDLFRIDAAGQEVFNRHHWFFSGSCKDPAIIGGPNRRRWDTYLAVQQAFLYVSVETVLQYPYPYLTEKTFRAILHKRPFVIVGAPGSLDQIKKLGFKTFDHIWNEDYDLIQDPNHRIRAVIKIVEEIGSLSSDQLKDLMYSVQDTVEFNYKFYVQEFSNTILNHRLDTI